LISCLLESRPKVHTNFLRKVETRISFLRAIRSLARILRRHKLSQLIKCIMLGTHVFGPKFLFRKCYTEVGVQNFYFENVMNTIFSLIWYCLSPCSNGGKNRFNQYVFFSFPNLELQIFITI
jgi:hypothetical protein